MATITPPASRWEGITPAGGGRYRGFIQTLTNKVKLVNRIECDELVGPGGGIAGRIRSRLAR
jgi:hypothetical protein